MDQKLIKEFLAKTEKLGLLAEVHLDGTYAEFTSSIMMAFAKTEGGDETSHFLIELFLTPIACQLAGRPDINDGTMDGLARSFFASCSRFFETSLAAYFSSSAGNRLADPAMKGQYNAYLKELKQKEEERIRRQQEEQLRHHEQARRQEEERIRRQQEEQLRQHEQARRQEEERIRRQQEEQLRQHEQARKQEEERQRLEKQQNEACRRERLSNVARELSRFVFLGIPSGIIVAIPLFTHGLIFYQEWVPAENVTAFVFYVICALLVILSGIGLTMNQTAKSDEDINNWTSGLVFLLLAYQTFSLWSDVPNHIRAALIVSIFVAPAIPFIRGALAFYCLGNIAWYILYYFCKFLSWILWGVLGILGWIWSWTTQDIKTADSEIQKPRLQLVENAVKKEPSEPSSLKTNAVDNKSSPINGTTKSSLIELVSNDGRKIRAQLLAITTSSVVIQREDGGKFEIPISSLSEPSVNKVLEWRTLKKSQSSDSNEIQKGASMQVKADSILFQEVDQLTQWQKLKKGGDAKALSAYQEKLLSSRDAWQFTNSLRVRVLGHEAAKHQVHVEMTTPGRMLGTNWWLDDSALVQ